LIIQIFQGASLTVYDYIGTIFIIVALLSNNIFLRLQQRRTEPKERYKESIQEQAS